MAFVCKGRNTVFYVCQAYGRRAKMAENIFITTAHNSEGMYSLFFQVFLQSKYWRK